MGLIEEGQDSVAVLETSHAWTGCDNCAGAIGGGYDGEVNWKAIFALLRSHEPMLDRTHMGGASMLPWE